MLKNKGININDQLQNGLAKTKLIFNIPPFEFLPKNLGRKRNVFVCETNFGEPDDIVSEIVNETAG